VLMLPRNAPHQEITDSGDSIARRRNYRQSRDYFHKRLAWSPRSMGTAHGPLAIMAEEALHHWPVADLVGIGRVSDTLVTGVNAQLLPVAL
jgi:hypothetical protein